MCVSVTLLLSQNILTTDNSRERVYFNLQFHQDTVHHSRECIGAGAGSGQAHCICIQEAEKKRKKKKSGYKTSRSTPSSSESSPLKDFPNDIIFQGPSGIISWGTSIQTPETVVDIHIQTTTRYNCVNSNPGNVTQPTQSGQLGPIQAQQ